MDQVKQNNIVAQFLNIVSKGKPSSQSEQQVKKTENQYKQLPINKNTSKYAQENDNLNPLINPTRVAVVGASASRINPGKLLLDKYAVHCDVTAVAFQKIHGYQTVSKISNLEKQDLIVISVPKNAVKQVLQEILNLDKARAVQIITSGFEEMGDNQLRILLQSSKIPIQGTNCVGNISMGRDLTFLPGANPMKFLNQTDSCGDLYDCEKDCNNCTKSIQETIQQQQNVIGVISASGAFLTQVSHDLPISYGFSIGNQSKIDVTNYLKFFAKKKPDLVIVYMEKLSELQLTEVTKLIEQNQETKFVFYQSARNSKSQQQAQLHSGASGNYVSFNNFKNVVAQYKNVKIINSLQNLINYGKITSYKLDKQKCYCISQSGFISTVLAQNLNVQTQFASQAKQQIQEIFDKYKVQAHVNCNLDTTPQIHVEQLQQIIDIIISQCQENENVVVSVLPELYTNKQLKTLSQFLIKTSKKYQNKLVVTTEDIEQYTLLKDNHIQVLFRADSLNVIWED